MPRGSRGRSGRLGRLAAIARHEYRMAWRSRTTAAFALLVWLLLATACAVGSARAAAETGQRHRYQALVGEQFAAQPDRHPHRVSHYGYLLFRPRAPLGVFDSGIESFAGTSLFLEAHRQNTANFSAASQGSGSDRFGELTPAMVLQFFVPLLVFAVTGVSITREREAGTLPMLLCQGTSWPELVWGKWCGALAVLATVVGPGLALVATWSVAAGSIEWRADVVTRASTLFVVHVLFLAACCAVAVAVSAWQRTSRGALVWLVALWLGGWIVLPRTLAMAGTAWYPAPARATFDADVEARVKELGDTHNPDDPVFARLRASTLRQYGVSRVEDLPINYSGLLTTAGEAATTRAYREHLARLQDVYRRQNRLVAWLGALSPYLGVRTASMALAGADISHQLEFERQAEAYRYRLVQALNDLHQTQVPHSHDRYGLINDAPSRARIDAVFFKRLPSFDYAAPTLAWAVREQAGGLMAGLLGFAWAGLLLSRSAALGPR